MEKAECTDLRKGGEGLPEEDIKNAHRNKTERELK